MSIITQTNNNIIKIIIDELDKKDDIEEFLELLNNNNFLEISFFNVQTLQKNIILKLNSRKDSISIFTNDTTLKSYLMNLGFDLKFHENYYDKQTKLNLKYLALGGSAGSLEKFINIIEILPKSDLTIFIIMHQRANIDSSLSTILQNHTKNYNVVEAKSDMKIEPATIYTAPPGYHMIIAGDFIFLTTEAKRNFSKPSISTSFESLSNEFKNSLLAVIVCGYGSDGSDSLKLLQKNESTIIIEDPSECKAKDILTNAINNKIYNHIYTIKEINKFILSYLKNENFSDKDLVVLLDSIYQTYGYDYTGYNIRHIRRRVDLFYSTLKSKNFLDFQEIVLTNKNIFQELFLNISVNITTFYRNPEVFKILRKEILPKLDSFVDIKIWCAGCSSGEEPYSIAIFLKELGLLDKSLIYATDINGVILKNAENALYSKDNYNTFLKYYYQAGGNESFSKYFIDHDNFVELNNELKDKILFFRHNLALDSKINDFQLIFCRNVIIYFDNELKNRIFDLFHESLDNYGFLILGESESLDSNKKYNSIYKKNKIYKRKI